MIFKFFYNLNTILKRSTSSKTMNDIKTFIFFDMETTGLPSQEFNKTKMMELCFISVQAEHIKLGVFPRVQNKLTLCVNPRKMISLGSTEITGLSNDLLEKQNSFNSGSVEMIKHFLNHNAKPICLVAHNGDNFDFPILRSELINVGNQLDNDILCVDALKSFKYIESQVLSSKKDASSSNVPFEFSDDYDELLIEAAESIEFEHVQRVSKVKKINETTPRKQIVGSGAKKCLNFAQSYKLVDVYKRLTSKEPINAHEAESDTNMLIMCCATLGEKFVDWCNINAKKFCDIPPMVPGKKIGT